MEYIVLFCWTIYFEMILSMILLKENILIRYGQL